MESKNWVFINIDIVEDAKKTALFMLENRIQFKPIPLTSRQVTEDDMSLAVSLNQDYVIGGVPFDVRGTTFYVGMRIDEDAEEDCVGTMKDH